MNIWFRRFLVILTVGGGFLGVVMTVNAAVTATNTPVIAYAMFSVFTALYAYGIFAGIGLSEDPGRYRHVLFFFALQVPFFSSPILVYRFACGLQATVAMVGLSFGWMFRLGSDWQLAVLQPNSWGVGVNLFAAAILFALVIHSLSEDSAAPEKSAEEGAPPSIGY